MIDYTIDENSILLVQFRGKVGFDVVIEWLEEFTLIPDLLPRVNIIYDLREAVLDLDFVKLVRIGRRADEATKKYVKVRTAFVIPESKVSAYTLFFTFLKSNNKTTRKAYSSFQDAYNWILGKKKEPTKDIQGGIDKPQKKAS